MPPRGTRDILPGEARLRDRVIGEASRIFAEYGYGHIQTPTFEETEVFVRGVGTSTDIVRKEMYTFEDGSAGRSPSVRRGRRPWPARSWTTACTSGSCR